MSWLFGMKPPPMPTPATSEGTEDLGPPAADGKKGADDHKTQTYKKDSRMAYTFDSSALERAARAAKDLEKSPHAKEFLELAKQQEDNRRLELETKRKEFEAGMESAKIEQIRAAGDEKRKSIVEENKHFKNRADYEDQLAKKRLQEELASKQRMEEESLRKQIEATKRQEEIRKNAIEHELQIRHKYEMERIKIEMAEKAKTERANKDVYIEQMRAQEAEKRQTMLNSIKARSDAFGAAFDAFITDPSKILSTVGGLSLLALGVYTAKSGTSVAARFIEARIGQPKLITETSRLMPLQILKHPIKALKQIYLRPKDPMTGVVFNPELEKKLRDIAITTKNTKKNRGLFRNIMFYGPPGTGKTMFAKRLAEHSGMHYAIMTGGDVAPMGAGGVAAIHKVFDWAKTSRKGLLLFVDEADAFLRKRTSDNISEHMRTALNAFLYRTGESSNKFMLCVASNQPEQFDWAVNDRIDELVSFDLPGLDERKRMLLVYFRKYIAEPALSKKVWNRLKLADFDWVKKCNEMAEKTDGLSGREISKLAIRWQAAAYGSEDGVLTPELMDIHVEQVMKEHKGKMVWLDMERRKSAQQMYEHMSVKTMASLPMFKNWHDANKSEDENKEKQETARKSN